MNLDASRALLFRAARRHYVNYINYIYYIYYINYVNYINYIRPSNM